MDLVSKSHSINHVSRALLSPITSPQPGSLFRTSSLYHQNDNTSFPIIAIAIIGILATAFLLVSYYVFVIKCCLNWHRIDLLRRFSLSAAANRAHEELLMASAYSAGSLQTRGLDESAIRSIPVFHFRKDGLNHGICLEKKSIDDDDVVKFSECAVCLNEFEEDEKLRIIPNCAHVFHIDCIDVWLQSNANCPLCRTSISTNRFQFDPVIAPSPSPIWPDEDYVVIELSNNNNNNNNSSNGTDQIVQRAAATAAPTPPAEASPRKIENSKKKKRLSNKGTSMGDECIDTREKDDVFAVQPIRRSVSMDSSADRKMFLAIQEAVRHCREGSGGEVIASVSPIEGGCSTSSSNTNIRVKRSFFSFGHGRGGSSRSAVLPVYLEP